MTYQQVYTDLDEERLLSRKVDEFMGIGRTLAKKDSLAEEDVRYLAKWLEANKSAMNFPLVRPISDLIKPGLLTPAHRTLIHQELWKLIADLDGDGISDCPTLSVYDDPPPKIIFYRKRFCFTGTLDYGERWQCEQAVEDRKGTCGAIAQCTDYLVIGAKITDAWKHSTFGNKISQARAWQMSGQSNVRIVSEEHWVKCLNDTGPNDVAPEDGPSAPQLPSGPTNTFSASKKSQPPFGRRACAPS